MASAAVNREALKNEIRAAIINSRYNVCPLIVRLAWHSAGTYDASDNSGGINGAHIRFVPEMDDAANAGLTMARALLQPVKLNHPEISYADLYAFAGITAVEALGGPEVDFKFGRFDAVSGASGVAHGRLPDASQGAAHLRDVFHRMGFNDREIVALSGCHTIGSCHPKRSGFAGAWTDKPLSFDNDFFKLLLDRSWVAVKNVEGNTQYQDKETGKLMMLPTDMALIQDPVFLKHVKAFAADEKLFFKEFKAAFGKLISLGCPQPKSHKPCPKELATSEFIQAAQHGNLVRCKELAAEGKADIHAAETTAGQTALHKSAMFNHVHIMKFLLPKKLDVNAKDYRGWTPLHEAATMGNMEAAHLLLAAGADSTVRDNTGSTAADIAQRQGFKELAGLIFSDGSLASKL